MDKLLLLILSPLLLNCLVIAQNHKILESTQEYIKIEVNFENTYQIKEKTYNGEKFSVIEGKEVFLRKPGEPWLPNYIINIGIPINSTPSLKILSASQEKKPNVFILPTPDSLNQPFEKLPFDEEIYSSNTFFPKSYVITEDYIVRYAHLANLKISPYQFNPVSRELLFNKKIIIQVDFQTDANVIVSRIEDNMTDNVLKSQVINYDIAKDFIGKEVKYSDVSVVQDTYWYNPQKDYYKIYLNKEGVYRITYDYLVNAGVPPSGLQNNRLELFCNGESIPIDVVDVDSNGFFNSGDYFQFVGYPAKPADAYTRMNIYNKSNVYWFSYQADTLNYYKNINGYPTTGFSETISNTVHTLKWEKDLIYNPLGHSRDSKRDYWYWQAIEARRGTPHGYFMYLIVDSIWNNLVVEKPQGRIKVGLHGLTTPPCQNGYAHKAAFIFNGHEFGSVQWDSQEVAVFDKIVHYSFNGSNGDTLWIRWQNNQELDIYLTGEVCNSDTLDDQVLVNYIELQYWRWNRTYPNYFYFTSPPGNYQDNRYYLWQWQRNNMKIYIPQRGELISNPLITNNQDLGVWFQDTIYEQTNYYCVANDYYVLPDSIAHQVSNSDLRNTTNGADYIIITHPMFMDAANQLAAYRLSNLSGYDFPRVEIVNVFDIYNEFSYGLLNPFALKDFAKYVFENWQQPAPSYITLLGDASFDYRKIFSTSRNNFVPSVPFHGFSYGQLPSDNSIVIVNGNEYPDIAIGRLSCETLEEANIIVNKIINYPVDNSKPWKENVILLASGLNYGDQQLLQFNNRAKELEREHLLPNGINSTKVFNYPDTTTNDIQFWGDGPRMRQEINKGAVAVSYYGHGGGAQWDLIFTKDDIPELNNGGKLPFVSSITCYTAHFDNAESFGEIFVKVPDKGAIGFWGSVSLTWWPMGHLMNKELFKNIFTRRNYIVGSAILNTFISNVGTPMIRQIAYLGDPALELVIPKFPDFEVKSSDIRISPEFPLKDDTVTISLKIRNLGVTFPNDSVTIELFKSTIDTSNLIDETKFQSFGHEETILMEWIPSESGLYNLIARINGKNIIEEIDHSDNIASRSFSVFDFGKPNVIKPINGYFSNNETIEFVLSDIGLYFNRDLNYIIQINDIPQFEGSILIQSPVLKPSEGIVRWESPSFQTGEYFWRSLVYDPIDTNTSFVRTFSISNTDGSGYLTQKKHLQLFDLENVDYIDELGILKLNTEIKPPHPDQRFFLDSIKIIPPEDSTRIVIFTTDGTYFYFTDLPEFISEPKIYRIGTGLNGTVAGMNYGPIPDPLSPTDPLSVSVRSHMFCMNGFLYVSTGQGDNVLKINPFNGDTLRVFLTDSLILTNNTPTQLGGYYFYYDGQYVYNLAMGSPLQPDKFVLRTLDPLNNWKKVREDIILSGSLVPNVNSFIVVDSTIVLLENRFQYYLRSYQLPDGTFLEEWRHSNPPRGYFAIAYDYQNNFVYFSLLKLGVQPGFERYMGKYIDANGRITSPEIGPASKWHDLQFEIDQTNSNGTYKAYLLGKNENSGLWETLDTLTQSNVSLENINASEYKYVQFNFELTDSSFGADEPMKFKSLQVNYDYLPEISMIPKDMTFAPDSMLQGIDVNMNLKIYNYGYINADSVRIDFYLNDGDSVFFTKYLNVKVDSFEVIDQVIETDTIIFDTKIKAVATTPVGEYFTFNNLIENDFYIARDSTKPVFNITFDGQEILDGDIVSSKPEVVITLKDNTPLQWDESHFTIVYDNVPLDFTRDSLVFEQVSPYPNSEVRVTWTPFIKEDGEHTLEVLAKDPSGNFFDSTSYRVSFFVFNNSDIRDVYNYPNPFGDNTHFTFELRGVNVPEELRIRVYTIAGRMIKELKIPSSLLQIGFNSIFWDGKDHDGDEIANGLYFYKVIYKNDDVVKTVTQKLAKIK